MRNKQLNSIPIPPEPNDPVPVHDPKPRPRPLPDPPPDDEPIKLSHRERRSATLRASRLSAPKCNARNNCDRFFNSECFARRPAN